MAATIASLGSAFTTTAGNKTVTATPTVGDLIVVIAVASGVATSAVTDNQGGTYTQVGTTRTGFSTTGNLQIFVRDNLVSSAASTVYTATQTSSTGGGLVVLRVTGMTLTGAAAVRSSGGESAGSSGVTPQPVLNLIPLSGNPIITAVANASNSTTTLVERAGYTEAFDNGYNTPPTGLEVNYLASGETSATLNQGSTSGSAFASQSIELAYQATPTTALNTPADTATGVSTTPTLNFTGTDANGDAVEYEVQVDSVNTFTGQAPLISNGTKYYITIERTGALDAVNTYKVYASSANPIAGDGIAGRSNGSWFSEDAVYDMRFIVYDTTLTAQISQNTGAVLYGNVKGDGGSSTLYERLGQGITSSVANFNLGYIDISLGVQGSPTDGLIVKVHTGSFTGTVIATSSIVSGSSMSTSQSNVRFIFPLIDKLSTTDAGFTAGHPFASGVAKDFTVQAGDTLTGSTTYYWRVRAIDPTGSNTYGAWSSTRSFTTASSGTAYTSTLTDSITLTETLGAKAVTKIRTETALTLTETLIKASTFARTLTESALSLVETLIKANGKAETDSITLTESTAIKATGQTKTESISLTELFSKAATATKVLTDSITHVETIIKSTSRSITETAITLTETFTRNSGFSRILTDSISLVESLQRSASKAFAEVITLTESITKAGVFARVLTDSVTLSEALIKAASKAFTESVSLSELFSRVSTIARTFTESISLTESLQKATAKFPTENITLSEVFSRAATFARTFSESLGLTEVFSKNSGKTSTDSVSLIESFSKTSTFARVLTDSITLVESFIKNTARQFTETALSLVESLQKVLNGGIQNFTMTFTESVSLNELFEKTASFFASFTESISLSESFSRAVQKTFSESVSLVESFAKTLGNAIQHYTLVLTDSISLTENLQKSVQKVVSDSVSFIESLTKSVTRNLSDFLNLVEQVFVQSAPFKMGSIFVSYSYQKTMATFSYTQLKSTYSTNQLRIQSLYNASRVKAGYIIDSIKAGVKS